MAALDGLLRMPAQLFATTGARAYGSTGKSLVQSQQVMDGLMQRIRENNLVSAADLDKRFVPFKVDGEVFGYLKPDFAAVLEEFSDTFVVNADSVQFAPAYADASVGSKARTDAVARVTNSLRERGVITGWRDELLPVVSSFSADPVFLIERAAYPWFGTRGYGVHINGYVKDESSAFPKLWLAVRSKTKQTWPGMLDHIVAGAQPHGISVVENVVKECEEEASIPRELAEKAVPSSCVSYTSLDEQGRLKRDAIFVFDLQLPKDFEPTPCDGEVDRFYLRDLDWVLDKLVTGGPEVVAKSPEDGFKPNCNLVVMDFLARQGYLSPDSPKYLELLGALRQAGCA
eukprot:TRINITY_DN25964_c0_g1_i3.p1 TRINITY_DN25964_c0_g1~~TRINITY_DN25964_c0_g1_i3.p1  ORF type:complete len:391 (-),score=61.94 TRINITY_DN25964_c0_g1_i3:451-1482(-)